MIMKETKKMKFTECLSHLFVFIKPYRFKLLFGILMVITAQVTFALNPTVEGMITTQLAADISAHQPIQVDKVVHILCILFSIYIVKTISQFLMAVFMTDAIQKTMFDVRNAIENKIHHLPVSYFDQEKTGELLSRITNDVDTLSNMYIYFCAIHDAKDQCTNDVYYSSGITCYCAFIKICR